MTWVLIVWTFFSGDGNARLHHVPGLASREACEAAGSALKASVGRATTDYAIPPRVAFVCAPEGKP